MKGPLIIYQIVIISLNNSGMSNVNTILFIGTLSNALLKSKQNSPIIKATKKIVTTYLPLIRQIQVQIYLQYYIHLNFGGLDPSTPCYRQPCFRAYSCFLLNIINWFWWARDHFRSVTSPRSLPSDHCLSIMIKNAMI